MSPQTVAWTPAPQKVLFDELEHRQKPGEHLAVNISLHVSTCHLSISTYNGYEWLMRVQ